MDDNYIFAVSVVVCDGLNADGCTYLEPQSFISEFRPNFGKTSGHNARIITFYSVLCRMLIYKYMYYDGMNHRLNNNKLLLRTDRNTLG